MIQARIGGTVAVIEDGASTERNAASKVFTMLTNASHRILPIPHPPSVEENDTKTCNSEYLKAGHYRPVMWKRCKRLANYFLKRDLSKTTNTEYVFLKSNADGDAFIFEVYLPKYFTGQQLQAFRRVC